MFPLVKNNYIKRRCTHEPKNLNNYFCCIIFRQEEDGQLLTYSEAPEFDANNPKSTDASDFDPNNPGSTEAPEPAPNNSGSTDAPELEPNNPSST